MSQDVTYENTVKHWTLYTLDAIEADRDPEDDSENPARRDGVAPDEVYEYAAGDDSIIFRNRQEVSKVLGEMARKGNPFDPTTRPVERRSEGTDWDEPDVRYRYRLTEMGRDVLLELDRPTMLPNRQDFDDEDRELSVVPAHHPGWWEADYELYDDEWDVRDHDWIPTEHNRVFLKDEGAEALDRGYRAIGTKLADEFQDVTFVLTVGPHRSHDMAYAIRDPWRKVVQIDIYSPMAMHRSQEEVSLNFEALVRDLRRGLAQVSDETDPATP